MTRIFVVEDDEHLRDEVATLLEHNGYEVVCTSDYANVVAEVLAAAPDLALLDLTLPQVDGQVVCRELRARSEIPILVATSRDNDLDELLALSHGADGFIAKPFNPQILLAHVTALLRRVSGSTAGDCIAHEGMTLDLARGTVSYREKTAELSRNEVHLLHALMSRAGTIVSRADLQDELWQTDEFVDDNTLTVNITRLRATLASIGVPDDYLQTRRGMGYLLR